LSKGEITRKKIGAIFGIATVASFVLFGITTDSKKNDDQIEQQPVVDNTQTVTENKDDNPAPVVEKTKTAPTPAKTETKTIPAPTPTPTPTPVPSQTVSQKNAVAKAKSYLGFSAFSHDGLVAQLEYEQFSHADAVYGADNSGANWNEQAAKKAKQYMEYSAFSRGSLIDQLKYSEFTQEQAEYGANAVGLLTPTAPAPTTIQAPTQTVSYDWTTYAALPDNFSKNPPAYIGTKVKLMGTVIDFFAKGDRGGDKNLIEIITNNGSVVGDKFVLQIDDDANYQEATQSLNALNAVAAYGTIAASNAFSTAAGGALVLPTLKAVRLDKCGSIFCDQSTNPQIIFSP